MTGALAESIPPTFPWDGFATIKVQTVAQVLTEQAARPTFLIEGLVHASATLVYGPAKAGKSHLVVELVAAVARGGEWQGQRVLGGPRPVLVLTSDPGGRAEYSRRFGDSVDDTVGLALPPRAGDQAGWARTVTDAMDSDVGLIVLDNLYSWARVTDINASAEVGAALACLDEVVNAAIPLLVVHHTSKSGSTPAGVHSIEAYFRHLLHLTSGGQLVVRGNDVPETRYQLRRDAGRTIEVNKGGQVGDARIGRDAGASRSGARRSARDQRIQKAQALVASAPAGLSDRALARYLVSNVDGIHTESQGRTLLATVRRLALAGPEVASTSR